MQVMHLILAGQVDPKTAGLLLYALQTASLNLRHMKLEPFHHESVVIDPRAVADNGVDEDAWCKEEFEEEEEDEEEEGDEEDSEDEEDADEEDEEEAEEDSAEEDGKEESEDDPEEHPQKKPVRVARAACPERAEENSPGFPRQPGANRNALFPDPEENAIARQLLELIDFGSPPAK
jgi:hypothetical protein